jgi:hypothetical protein
MTKLVTPPPPRVKPLTKADLRSEPEAKDAHPLVQAIQSRAGQLKQTFEDGPQIARNPGDHRVRIALLGCVPLALIALNAGLHITLLRYTLHATDDLAYLTSVLTLAIGLGWLTMVTQWLAPENYIDERSRKTASVMVPAFWIAALVALAATIVLLAGQPGWEQPTIPASQRVDWDRYEERAHDKHKLIEVKLDHAKLASFKATYSVKDNDCDKLSYLTVCRSDKTAYFVPDGKQTDKLLLRGLR